MIKNLILPKPNKPVKVCRADNARPFVLVCFSDQAGRATLMRAAYRQRRSGTIERLKPRWCLDVFHNTTTSHSDNQATPRSIIIVKLWSFHQNPHVIAFNLTFVLNSFATKLLQHLHIRAVKSI